MNNTDSGDVTNHDPWAEIERLRGELVATRASVVLLVKMLGALIRAQHQQQLLEPDLYPEEILLGRALNRTRNPDRFILENRFRVEGFDRFTKLLAQSLGKGPPYDADTVAAPSHTDEPDA